MKGRGNWRGWLHRFIRGLSGFSRDGATVTVVDNFDSFYTESVKRSKSDPSASALAVPVGGTRHPRRGKGVDRLIQGHTARCDRSSSRARGKSVPVSRIPLCTRRLTCWGPSHLLQSACQLEPRPRFVYASSSSVYGDRPDAPHFARQTRSICRSVRTRRPRRRVSSWLIRFHHLHGLPVTGPSAFFTAYGPTQPP